MVRSHKRLLDPQKQSWSSLKAYAWCAPASLRSLHCRDWAVLWHVLTLARGERWGAQKHASQLSAGLTA